MKVGDNQMQQKIELVLDRYQHDYGLLVSILQDIQAEYNYPLMEVLEQVS